MSSATPSEAVGVGAAALDVERLRADFPILARRIGTSPLSYLDNAATTQKPRAVLTAMQRFYEESYGSVARGVHQLSAEATRQYEAARARVAAFLGAASPEEIVFVRGTTEAANLVAWSFARPRLSAGDEILITELEHHSNLVPWQMVCEERGARLTVVPVDDRGEVDPEEFSRRLGPRTRLAAFAHVSNALGTILPVADLVRRAHDAGAERGSTLQRLPSFGSADAALFLAAREPHEGEPSQERGSAKQDGHVDLRAGRSNSQLEARGRPCTPTHWRRADPLRGKPRAE